MNAARLILTCGLPGARKTTLATQLAADRSAVRLTKDEWLRALGSSPWDRPTGEKIEQELWRLAQDILSLGLSVVLDFGLWARIERDEMRTVARGLGVGVELHYLEVPTDELWRRIEVRNSAPPWDNEPIGRADLDEWLAIFQARTKLEFMPAVIPDRDFHLDHVAIVLEGLLPRRQPRTEQIDGSRARRWRRSESLPRETRAEHKHRQARVEVAIAPQFDTQRRDPHPKGAEP